ncbi:ester cyclase [Flavisolibacter nicotianae]|uniref:ester cyclase n=1 Tax=Flavisolibacter nicotianae TaxID=2364882 RepID=UPI0013C524E8|nr:ester cyclase [Flavisolibacter nicotianae]
MRNTKSTLLYRWFEEVWNQNREDSIDQLMTTDSHAHGIIAPGQPKGAAGFKTFYRDFKKQFDAIHIAVKDVVAQDDMECGLTEVTARHRETGKAVKFSGLCMVRVENGKIAEAWNHYDFLGMHQQLGQVLTPMEAA